MKLQTKELTTCALFAALIAVGAFLKIDIPLPMYTMHFTLQWFFVLMAGFLLGKKLATTSVIVYLCIGLVGIPVFAAGGGPTYIFRPGFLIRLCSGSLFHGRHYREVKESERCNVDDSWSRWPNYLLFRGSNLFLSN